MARAILADITDEFKTEIPECGNASNCYCISCTGFIKGRGKLWRLFAAWRQVARNSNNDPATIKLAAFCNQYRSSVLQYNEVVVVVQDIGNCNGEYAAGITALIMAYCNPPTVWVVALDYMSCNQPHPIWTDGPQVLTYWYDPNWVVFKWRWAYLRRRTLFKMFYDTMLAAIMPDIKNKFNILKNSIPAISNGKFKNNLYILNFGAVIVPDSNISIDLTVVDVFDPAGRRRIEVWHQYWGFYEAAFGL